MVIKHHFIIPNNYRMLYRQLPLLICKRCDASYHMLFIQEKQIVFQIVELKRDPKGKKRPIRAKLPPKPAVFNNEHASPTYNQKIRQLMDDNYKYRCILEQVSIWNMDINY